MKHTFCRVAVVVAFMAALSAPWPGQAKGRARSTSASSAQQPETRHYKVRPGDTLSEIARRFGTTPKKLQTANRLKNSRIKAGQSLALPSLPAETQATETHPSPADPLTPIEKPAAAETPAGTGGPAESGTATGVKQPVPEQKARSARRGAQKPAAPRTYKVRRGDTLFQIARQFDTTPKELQAANNLKGSRLAIGQTLRLTSAPDAAGYAVVPYAGSTNSSPNQVEAPARQAEAPARQAEAPAKLAEAPAKQATAPAKLSAKPEAEPRQERYTVRKGDTLFQIARRFDTTPKELQTANRLKGTRLKVGQTLQLPGVVTVAANARPVEPVVKAPAVPDLSAYVPRETAEEEDEELPARLRLVEAGFKMLGIRYRYGGTSEKTGLDCSALVRNLFSKFNLNLPRSSREQFQQGEKIDRKDLEAGDLVFFSSGGKTPTHVGIYIGDNKFLHAARKAKKVIVSDLGKLWYEKRYLGARRIMDLWWEESEEEPRSASH